MGQGPRFRHISTADSAVGPPHAGRLDRKEQAALGYSGAMAFARRDQDRFTRSGHEWTCLELDAKLALEHQKELVARLTMPAAIEPSRPRV